MFLEQKLYLFNSLSKLLNTVIANKYSVGLFPLLEPSHCDRLCLDW